MKNVKDFFENNMQEWSNEFFEEKKQYHIVDLFYECYSKVKKTRPRIIDIGCGIGYNSRILSELGAKVVGIDFSKNNIDVARAHVPNVEFYERNILNNLSDLEKFEGALCLETINYITPENMKTCISNIANILKSGALLLISVLDGKGKNDERSLTTINGENYDKNFYCYDAETLCQYAYPYFMLADTWQFNDFEEGWRYYVLIRQPS